jgi:hypothetical protein
LVECVDTEDDEATYEVTWTRQDTGATATASFVVSEVLRAD